MTRYAAAVRTYRAARTIDQLDRSDATRDARRCRAALVLRDALGGESGRVPGYAVRIDGPAVTVERLPDALPAGWRQLDAAL